MCETEAWLALLRSAGLTPWRADGETIELLGDEVGGGDGLPTGRRLPLRTLFGEARGQVRSWLAGAGDGAATFTLSGRAGGERVEMLRGPACPEGLYGSIRSKGRHPGRAECGRDLMEAMIGSVRTGAPLSLVLVGIRDFDLLRFGCGQLNADGLFDDIAERLSHAAGGATVYEVDGLCLGLILRLGPADATDSVQGILEDAFAAPLELDGLYHRLAVRAGVAVFPADGVSVQELVHGAALALSASLRLREETVIRTDPDRLERIREDMRIASGLGEAISRNQLSFELQPIVDLDTESVAAAELLARWTHPVLGRVSPARFVPLAERQDLLMDMTIAMLRRLGRSLQSDGTPDMRIAVNIAPSDFSWRKIGRLIDTVRHERLLPLDRLTLEITETGMMQTADGVAAAIANALRERGIALAIDDFGTGFSSFGQLNAIPVDILKIDRTLAQDLHIRQDRQRLVAAITDMAGHFGMTTVVEGLELREEVAAARALGCDRVQGYVYSPPLDVGAFTAYCHRRAA